MTADFIDTRDILNRTIWRVHPLDRLVARRTDFLDYALVSFVFGIDRQNMFARRVEDHSANGIPRNCRSSSSSHGISWSTGVFVAGVGGVAAAAGVSDPGEASLSSTAGAVAPQIASATRKKNATSHRIGEFKILVRE